MNTTNTVKLLKEIQKILNLKYISKSKKQLYIEKIDNILSFELKQIKNPNENNLEEKIENQSTEYKNLICKMKDSLKTAYNISEKLGIGDIYSYSKVKEVLIAEKLGHKVAMKYSGADAYNENDLPVEYKSTISRIIKATYNGISVQPSWEQQVDYITKNKIGKYKYHYFARFKGIDIIELYEMKSEKVIKYILPRLKKQYYKEQKGKDPRLGLSLGHDFIKNNSRKIV